MFGYVVVNKPELKIREFDEYRAFYCGLCHSLKDRYGRSGQITLNYDMNFLAVLLTALYEPETKIDQARCIMHPVHKHLEFHNDYIDYCADMTILLSYYKCADDWKDERKWLSKAEMILLEKKVKLLEEKYPEKCQIVKKELEKISEYEKNNEMNIDTVANATGRMMGTLFEYRKDEWAKTLYEIGFYLGKYIYLIDAWEDVEKDIETGNYNLFKSRCKDKSFDEDVYDILEMMMAECTSAFETLPIFDYRDILRNILYSGVWTKRELVLKKKEETKHE